jgi:hypothetical protein
MGLLWLVAVCSYLAPPIGNAVVATEEFASGGAAPGGSAGGAPPQDACSRVQQLVSTTQDKSPTDIGGVLKAVTSIINQQLTDVVMVKLVYAGDAVHRVVGHHEVTTTVQRLVNGEREESCIQVTFEILDVDECNVPSTHPWHHRCDPSTRCVNTVGSYECECQNGETAIPGSGSGECGGSVSTAECCGRRGCSKPECIERCKEDFRCYMDLCPGTCVPEASCKSFRGQYTCTCPKGTHGNGRACPRGADRVTLFIDPHTRQIIGDEKQTCGCQVPLVDYCSRVNCGRHTVCNNGPDGHVCKCEKGFKLQEGFGCVDETLPSLQLVGDNPLHMTQCQEYEELGLKILDENSEDYARFLEVDYSMPLGVCLATKGSFHVNYTIETPWTDPPFLRIQRMVFIDDVDECALPDDAECEACRTRCHPIASCVNTDGSYTCKCPRCTTGDGFLPTLFRQGEAPDGYKGGTGCVDSCPPIIELLGSPEKEFRVCKCTTLGGGDPLGGLKRDFGRELRELVSATGGRALCDPENDPCVHATDMGSGGSPVDITDRVIVGEPVEVDAGSWRVPYDAVDDAGNRAKTVYRNVHVVEMSLDEYAASLSVEGQLKLQQQSQPKPAMKAKPPRHHSQRHSSTGAEGAHPERADCPECPACETCAPCKPGAGAEDTAGSNEALATIARKAISSREQGAGADDFGQTLVAVLPTLLLTCAFIALIGVIVMLAWYLSDTLAGSGGGVVQAQQVQATPLRTTAHRRVSFASAASEHGEDLSPITPARMARRSSVTSAH